jgi:hypothetical protein
VKFANAVDEWTGYATSAEIDEDTTKAVAADIERVPAALTELFSDGRQPGSALSPDPEQSECG